MEHYLSTYVLRQTYTRNENDIFNSYQIYNCTCKHAFKKEQLKDVLYVYWLRALYNNAFSIARHAVSLSIKRNKASTHRLLCIYIRRWCADIDVTKRRLGLSQT